MQHKWFCGTESKNLSTWYSSFGSHRHPTKHQRGWGAIGSKMHHAWRLAPVPWASATRDYLLLPSKRCNIGFCEWAVIIASLRTVMTKSGTWQEVHDYTSICAQTLNDRIIWENSHYYYPCLVIVNHYIKPFQELERSPSKQLVGREARLYFPCLQQSNRGTIDNTQKQSRECQAKREAHYNKAIKGLRPLCTGENRSIYHITTNAIARS